MIDKKMEALLKKHAAVLQKIGRKLAMNSNGTLEVAALGVSSRDIIFMGCAEMGITERQYRALQNYLEKP